VRQLITVRRRAPTAAPADSDTRSWGQPLGAIAVAVAIGGTLGHLPPVGERRTAVLVVLAAAVLLWLGTVVPRGLDASWRATGAIAIGIVGVLVDALAPKGFGLIFVYICLLTLALVWPLRPAVIAGLPVITADAIVGFVDSRALSSVIQVVLGAGSLFVFCRFLAVNREARSRAEALLIEEAANRAVREENAAMSERARLARELHDILSHTLAGIAVQLEGTRLLATQTGSDPRVVDQLVTAHRLTADGMASARRAVSALRGDELPGVAGLPALVAGVRRDLGLEVSLASDGAARPLSAEVGLTIYRAAQEALSNVAKYGGRGARVRVELSYADTGVWLEITNTGGEPTEVSLPSGGYGLAGMAERVALLGGQSSAGPITDGFRVSVRLPYDGSSVAT
jgi:signal transduction histidine kinase